MLSALVLAGFLVAACSQQSEQDERPVSPPAELPVPRTEVAGAAVGGRITVAGGLTADGVASDLVHVYDPDANKWTEGPKLPAPLHHQGVAAARGRVWVVGGYTNASAQGQWTESAAVWSLDPAAAGSGWRDEIPLPEPRAALGLAATRDGTIVAFGGVAGGGVVATTRVLRPGSSTWEKGPDLAVAREHTAATVIDERVFAIAGRAGSLESNLVSVESWDPSAGEPSWRAEPDLNDSRGGTAAAARCVAGGEEPAGTIASVECLSADGRRWERRAELGVARHGLAVVALGDRLHVIGGGDKPGLFVTGAHEVLTTTS